MMKVFDVSLDIAEDMPTYRGRKERKPIIERVRTLRDGANETKISFDSHTGTHVDAPLHMLDSPISIDRIPVTQCMGHAVVLELRHRSAIDEEDLRTFEPLFFPDHFIIFKTDNSFSDLSREDFVYLTERAARFLAGKKLRGVGTDALGVERDQPGHPTHKILLESGMVIVEGLALRDIEPGLYFFIVLPLKIRGGDGAPARAILLQG